MSHLSSSIRLTVSRDTETVIVDCLSEAALHQELERVRSRGLLLRLKEMLEEGSRWRVEFRAGGRSATLVARVRQVFRSGADLFGTMWEVESWGEAEDVEANLGGVKSLAVGRPSPLDDGLPPLPVLGQGFDSLSESEPPSAPEPLRETGVEPGLAGVRPSLFGTEASSVQTDETIGSSVGFGIHQMNPAERVRLAGRANRPERQLLVRDGSPAVSMALLNNSRLEPGEALELAKNPQMASNILQRLAQDPRFAANYELQLALVRNPQTPQPLATRLLESLRVGDLRMLARSQALREAVKRAALRIYLARSGR